MLEGYRGLEETKEMGRGEGVEERGTGGRIGKGGGGGGV